MSLLDVGTRTLGGLGLFLLGMALMTEGLRLAAGGALRDILALSTRTRVRGLGAGILVTALVQSSSAVTVAAIGFVNAGLLNLEQAVWVVFGSNVGTTMTGWLVALVGFKLKIEAFALPLVGIGMVLRLTGAGSRRSPVGLALVGFGLLFLGIETLKQAFAALGDGVTLPAAAGGGVMILVAYVLIGIALTTLMQSSSAALVVALSAAESGMVPLGAAAAVVIGANVGTTSTALISVLGATSAAKRVALAHVAFNLLTAAVALALVFRLIDASLWLQDAIGVTRSPATTLAVFHTLFNCLGVGLMWPLGEHLVGWLKKRFRVAEEEAARPRYLDRSALAVPQLALAALDRELGRVRERAASVLHYVFSPDPTVRRPVRQEAEIVQALVGACAEFIATLGRTSLPAEVAGTLAHRLRAAQHYAAAAHAADQVAALTHARETPLEPDIEGLEHAMDRQGDALAAMAPGGDAAMLTEAAGRVREAYTAFKGGLLRAGTMGRIRMPEMEAALERARLVRFASERMLKAAERMASAQEHEDPREEVEAPEASAGP